MTCIIGFKDRQNNRVYMGGDRMAGNTQQYLTLNFAHPKVFTKSVHNLKNTNEKIDILMGYTTSFRMGQLLQYELNLSYPFDGKLTMKHMVTKIIPELRDAYHNAGYGKKDDAEKMNGGTLLVGSRDSLFSVRGDFSVLEVKDNFASIGCGAELACGALFALKNDPVMSIPKKIKTAIEAAAHFSAYVTSECDIIMD